MDQFVRVWKSFSREVQIGLMLAASALLFIFSVYFCMVDDSMTRDFENRRPGTLDMVENAEAYVGSDWSVYVIPRGRCVLLESASGPGLYVSIETAPDSKDWSRYRVGRFVRFKSDGAPGRIKFVFKFNRSEREPSFCWG